MVGGRFLLDMSCRNLHVLVKLLTSWADALHLCIYVVAGMPPKFTRISFVARKVFYGYGSLNACSKLHYRINFLLIGCCYHIQFALWEDQLYDTGKQKQLWAVGEEVWKGAGYPTSWDGIECKKPQSDFQAGLQYVQLGKLCVERSSLCQPAS